MRGSVAGSGKEENIVAVTAEGAATAAAMVGTSLLIA
jgi:hypothetical protein